MTEQTANTSQEKAWEKVWSYNDMKSNSTNWSLAGDSGLLLHLKQFSENLISKSVEIEKKLQKLSHSEQQCLAKFNNVTSSFLLLENSQFIENRVYDHEITESIVKDSTAKKEKTKEEKELDLFNKMNEAVIMGMSIMDTYFERLDPNQAKSANSDQDDDDEDDILAANTSSNVDLFIYETKDPYVLRSLPYLIGSQAFLDNDHVGLKDLDSEDEEIDAGDEENGEDIGTVPDEDEDDDHYSDEDKSRTTNAPETKITKIENYDDSSSTSSSSGELFVKSKPSKINEKRKKPRGIFDDSDDDENDETSEEKDDQDKNVQNLENEPDKQFEEPTKPAQPLTLDFQSELNSRFANKNNPPANLPKQQQAQAQLESLAEPPLKSVIIPVPKSTNLFDSEEDDEKENNNLFQKNSKKISLFDDENENDDEKLTSNKLEPEIKSEVKSKAMPKSELTSALNDLFAKKSKAKSFLSDEDDQDPLFDSSQNKQQPKQQPQMPPQIQVNPPKKAYSLFDTDEEEIDFISNNNNKQSKPAEPAPSTSAPLPAIKQTPKVSNKGLFSDEDEEDLFPIASKSNPPATAATVVSQTQLPTASSTSKKISLFDSSDSSSPDFNIKPLPKTTSTAITPNKSNETSLKKTVNLFQSSDESSSPDLFSSTKIVNKPMDPNDVMFPDEVNDSMSELKNASTINKTSEQKKPEILKSKSFFDNSTEDESEDLFKAPLNKITLNNPTAVVMTDSKKNKQVNVSLFDGKSEEDDEDLFKSKPKIEIVKKPEQPITSNKLKEETDKESIIKTEPIKQSQVSLKPPAIESESTKQHTTDFDKTHQAEHDDEDDLFRTKSVEKEKSTKPIGAGKNMLFNPSALKNSNLFKKLAVHSKSSDEEDNEKEEVVEELFKTKAKSPADQVTENIDTFFDSPLVMSKATVSDELKISQIANEDDLFSNIKVDKAFSDSTLKTAQKDRIKAAGNANKKRPPNRRPMIEKLTDDMISEPIIQAPVSKSTEILVQKSSHVEPIVQSTTDKEPVKIQSSSSLLLNFEQKQNMSHKSLENIFDSSTEERDGDDDDEIFGKKPSTKKNQQQASSKTQMPSKPNDSVKAKEVPSLFDSSSLDDFDLFSIKDTKNKKKPEKINPVDDIFGDDIFSDFADLQNKKRNTDKPKKATTEPAKKTKPISNKNDLFATISDEDDIFSSKPTQASSKKDNDDKTSKKEYDDPLNLFNV